MPSGPVDGGKLDKPVDMQTLVDAFAGRMRTIHLFQRAAGDLIERELEKLVELDEAMKDHPEKETWTSSYHALGFPNLEDGRELFFGHGRLNIDARSRFALLHKNRQYQWWLAAAFEEFQDFMRKAYALVGSKDRDFWPLSDFGKVSLSELDDKDFDWFHGRAKGKDVIDIVKQIRAKRPRLRELEEKNAVETDLRIMLPLIQQLRHHIVHTGGKVIDQDLFKEKVFKASGIAANEAVESQYRNALQGCFRQDELPNTIYLLEAQDTQVPMMRHSRFRLFSNCLLAYAYAVSRHLLPT